MKPNALTITYQIPDGAPDWLFDCLRDGDYNGVLEWAMGRSAEKIDVIYADSALNHRCPTYRAEKGEACYFRPGTTPNGEGYKHMSRGML